MSLSCPKWTSIGPQAEGSALPAAGPFEFVVIDILLPLPKATADNRHVVIITDWFWERTRAIPTAKKNPTGIETIFLDNWVMTYGIPSYVLTDNGLQFLKKLVTTLCLLLGVKRLTRTANPPQMDGQAERFIRTAVARLRHCVSQHQLD